jgi:hypothetical protein
MEQECMRDQGRECGIRHKAATAWRIQEASEYGKQRIAVWAGPRWVCGCSVLHDQLLPSAPSKPNAKSAP